MSISMQSSWVVRKIIGAREYLKKLQNGYDWIQGNTFSIRNLYKEFMGNPPKIPWAKMVCQNVAPPKCLFITWLLLHERLATSSYLQRVGIHVDNTCCLCEGAEKSLDYMFFECEFASIVWRGVTDWCGIDRHAMKWELEKVFLLSQCTNNNRRQRLYMCMVAVISYHLWRERNDRRMKGKKNSEEMIIEQCKVMKDLVSTVIECGCLVE